MGYKLFALADHGYVWWFMWSSRKRGIAELIKHIELTPTGSMILQLVKKLPRRVMYTHQLEQGVKPHKIASAKAWREQLYDHLFSFSNDPSIRSRHVGSEKLPSIRMNIYLPHECISRQKRSGCIQCRAEMAARKRRRLEEGIEGTDTSTKIERASQTGWGCSLCKVALCRQGRCWELFHSKRQAE